MWHNSNEKALFYKVHNEIEMRTCMISMLFYSLHRLHISVEHSSGIWNGEKWLANVSHLWKTVQKVRFNVM